MQYISVKHFHIIIPFKKKKIVFFTDKKKILQVEDKHFIPLKK